jgi:hypothetical protein
MSFIIHTPQITNYVNSFVENKVSTITTTIDTKVSNITSSIDTKFDSKDSIVLSESNSVIPTDKISSVRYMSFVIDPTLNPNPSVELPELPATQVFYLINQTEVIDEQSFYVSIYYKGKMIGMLEAEYGIQLLYIKEQDKFFVI